MPATVGVAADVPPTSSGMPPMIVQNWSPFAHTSGEVTSSNMLGGASQIVSMIRVKCNGT